MGRLFGADPSLSYRSRLARLKASGVAVWDVLAAGEREGSLDSAIVASSIVSNDFRTFLARYPGIDLIGFNGRKAAELFERHVIPSLPEDRAASLTMRVLPSTSPAHASLSFEQKYARWAAVLCAERSL